MFILNYLRYNWLPYSILFGFIGLPVIAALVLGYERMAYGQRGRLHRIEYGLEQVAIELSQVTQAEAMQQLVVVQPVSTSTSNVSESEQKTLPLYDYKPKKESQFFDSPKNIQYYSIGKKFILIDQGPDSRFEEHPSLWFTAATTMDSREIRSRTTRYRTFLGYSRGDLYAIGEHQ
ncbi:MAG: hypothetical protein SFY68_15000 [Candidatus Sumerlaeia bacterium]|nr:hypothetical protein [Candidatus Sumerlaeia bacterium]